MSDIRKGVTWSRVKLVDRLAVTVRDHAYPQGLGRWKPQELQRIVSDLARAAWLLEPGGRRLSADRDHYHDHALYLLAARGTGYDDRIPATPGRTATTRTVRQSSSQQIHPNQKFTPRDGCPPLWLYAETTEIVLDWGVPLVRLNADLVEASIETVTRQVPGGVPKRVTDYLHDDRSLGPGVNGLIRPHLDSREQAVALLQAPHDTPVPGQVAELLAKKLEKMAKTWAADLPAVASMLRELAALAARAAQPDPAPARRVDRHRFLAAFDGLCAQSKTRPPAPDPAHTAVQPAVAAAGDAAMLTDVQVCARAILARLPDGPVQNTGGQWTAGCRQSLHDEVNQRWPGRYLDVSPRDLLDLPQTPATQRAGPAPFEDLVDQRFEDLFHQVVGLLGDAFVAAVAAARAELQGKL